jgi:2-keto-4-pentenoate hydratase/2-oxohepta-3-ene-1,7-dioic acid hydratase in catechol pathway
MRLGNLAGRTVLVQDGRALDVEKASGGKFSSRTADVLDNWSEFVAWGASADYADAVAFDEKDLGAPVPEPKQIFAIGLNYQDHATEAGLPSPEHLIVFTKFLSSLAGPNVTVELPGETVDYETELVVVIGTTAHKIDAAQGWDYVAGLSVGQDLSERTIQRRGPAAQFSLGKSFPNFSPFGPTVVSLDELSDKDGLRIGATLTGPDIDGTLVVQDGNTSDMIFSVPQIVADLSQIVTLFPGDLIFTGTAAGVGMSRGIFMKPGYRLTSTVDGIGTMTNDFVA